ncbi:hypothetical protein ACHHYP_09166 [Achlya hypogyna]|uniref:RWP-RK domain-containing protein n=1 Tax=Achlya hypogyna TaxID=1202772 RepID=A0A1V9ZJE2_ACHHY|nr:hypothetical protein ACHHYP_09166 [Achlya hypogyna]
MNEKLLVHPLMAADEPFVLRPLKTSNAKPVLPPWRPVVDAAIPSLPRFQTILQTENDGGRSNPAATPQPLVSAESSTLLHESQTQHMRWRAREQELMRRQRHAIAMKEKELGRQRRCAAPHRLQELFMRRQHEQLLQQEQQKRFQRNMYQLTYHRMLAEEDLQRLRHQELLQSQAKAQQLQETKARTFEHAVQQTPLDAASLLPAPAATTSPTSSNNLLAYLLPPVPPPPRNGWNVKDVTLNELRPHFNKPMAAVAQEMGVCITLMKKICRKNGLSRWPHRRIRSLVNRITSLQAVADTVVEKPEKARFQAHIGSLRKELSDVIQNPNGKSRKAQEYERRKDEGSIDGSVSSDDGPRKPPKTKSDVDLSCLEVFKDDKARGSISSLLCD